MQKAPQSGEKSTTGDIRTFYTRSTHDAMNTTTNVQKEKQNEQADVVSAQGGAMNTTTNAQKEKQNDKADVVSDEGGED